MGVGASFLDNTGADFDYGLAGFYLISSGVDAVGGHSLRPTDWPKSLSYDLGEPLGNRSTWERAAGSPVQERDCDCNSAGQWSAADHASLTGPQR